MMNSKKVGVLFGSLAIAGAAFAAVSLDPLTGMGWVGKGDIQLAYGWNDKTIQTRSVEVDFEVQQQVTVAVTCQIEKRGVVEFKTASRNRSLSDTQDGDPRVKNARFTGYFLGGYKGQETASGDPLPKDGDACKAEGEDGVVTSVVSTINFSKLFATYGGDKRLLGSF
jgi:hypothetical protein